MTVLADTSIWVEYLRKGIRGEAAELDRLLQADAVIVCGPVIAELIAGTPRADREELWLGVGGLPWVDLDHDGWRAVGGVAAALRAKGKTVALTDIMIAVICMAADAALWTHDSDFERIRSVEPRLRLHTRSG